jgi:hypothetical protein
MIATSNHQGGAAIVARRLPQPLTAPDFKSK